MTHWDGVSPRFHPASSLILSGKRFDNLSSSLVPKYRDIAHAIVCLVNTPITFG
ncbi:MAG: hypothetical protein ABIE43_05115 [Patescibacteria group bacterium]